MPVWTCPCPQCCGDLGPPYDEEDDTPTPWQPDTVAEARGEK